MMSGIVAAGSDTTSLLLADTLWLLLSRPDRWNAVVRYPDQVPAVIEETLRLRNPVRGLRRVTTRPGNLGRRRHPGRRGPVRSRWVG